MNAAFGSSMVAVCVSLPLLSGCYLVDAADTLAESNKHEGPIAAEIEAAVGKRPRVISANSGRILVVTVSFSEVPATPVPALEPIARAAIVREFKKDPISLTISFEYHNWR